MKRFGLASLDHISAELGLEDNAPELRAALERCVADDSISWYCNGIYGLSSAQLEGFVPENDLWAETRPAAAERDLGGALEELESAVKDLGSAMSARGIRETPAGEAPEVSAPGGQLDDPYEDLRRIQELHEAGVLTAEEFAAKKAEILKRI